MTLQYITSVLIQITSRIQELDLNLVSNMQMKLKFSLLILCLIVFVQSATVGRIKEPALIGLDNKLLTAAEASNFAVYDEHLVAEFVASLQVSTSDGTGELKFGRNDFLKYLEASIAVISNYTVLVSKLQYTIADDGRTATSIATFVESFDADGLSASYTSKGKTWYRLKSDQIKITRSENELIGWND